MSSARVVRCWVTVSYTHLDVYKRQVLICGPTVMMKNAARICAEKGTPCFVSLEKKMACGIGACLGCTCEEAKRNKVWGGWKM